MCATLCQSGNAAAHPPPLSRKSSNSRPMRITITKATRGLISRISAKELECPSASWLSCCSQQSPRTRACTAWGHRYGEFPRNCLLLQLTTAAQGVFLRGGLIASIFDRSMRLSNRARSAISNGKLIAHISTDVSRIDFALSFA